MSIWTHVIGAIRFDGLPMISREKFNVNTVKLIMEGKIQYGEHGIRQVCDVPLPTGSEGTIQFNIIEYSDGLPWVTVAIYGDLRDYEDAKAIETWFDNRCKAWPLVRDGVLRVQVEGQLPIYIGHVKSPERNTCEQQ